MSVLLEKDIKAVSIEYLPTERELDKSKPLVVGQGLLDSFKTTEDLTYRTFFGTKRYVTGLDPEIVRYDTSLSEEEKEAKIARINANVERLEKFFGPGQLDATNEKFWSQVKLVMDRKTKNLDLSDPRKEIEYHAMKAGGFHTVAPTLEIAQAEHRKFYLIEPIEFVENRVSPRKIFNEAIATLQKLDNKSFDEIFFIAKYLMPVERAYTRKTPKSLMYEDLDKFIKGEMITSQSKAQCARQFVEATKMVKDNMIVYCIVKDGLYFGMLFQNDKGEIKNNETSGIYGNDIESATKHLLMPAYDHELDNIKTRVEIRWSE